MNFSLRILRSFVRRREFLGLAVGASASIALVFWHCSGYIHTPCFFRMFTGVPCPTCGGTHSLSALLSGRIGEALAWNPLVVVACGIGAFYTIYAFGSLFFGLPVFRWEFSRRQHLAIRAVFLTAIGANWIYLILLSARRS